MKFVIYARKSTESEDRQVLSIDSQIKELREVAARMDLGDPTVMRESMSAKAPGRPVFNKLMELAESGKVDGILCWKLDRLARNPVDGGRIIWGVKNNGIHFVTPSQTYSPEEDNTILMYVEFGMAQKYIDDLGKNVKRGNRQKLETGWMPGSSPLGYINKLDDHTMVPDPERFPLIRKMWDLLLRGQTPEQVRQIANNEWGFRTRKTKRTGGKPLAKSAMYRLIKNPFYHGLIERRVEGQMRRYPGAHQPMITEEEFFKVHELMGFPSARPKHKPFALTGLIRCGECNAAITAEEKVKKSGKRYTYYRCTKRNGRIPCSQKPIPGILLESQIDTVLKKIILPEAFTKWAVKWLREIHKNEYAGRSGILQSLQNTYNTSQTKLDRLTDAMLENLISQEEYRVRKESLLLDQQRLKEKIRDTEQQGENWVDKVEQAFDFASTAQKRFQMGTDPEKRSIAISLGTKFILKDGRLSLELQKIWEKLSESAPSIQNNIVALELTKNGEPSGKLATHASIISDWQGWGESNPPSQVLETRILPLKYTPMNSL